MEVLILLIVLYFLLRRQQGRSRERRMPLWLLALGDEGKRAQ